MQARELTTQEVEEGNRHINEQNLSATQVQALVRQMDSSKRKWRGLKQTGKMAEYEEALKNENTSLYFNYPSLFQMHLEDRVDSTFFEMLALKRKIEKGEITPEQASSVVGQSLFNRFAAPAIGQSTTEAPRMKYEDFYKQ
jgi:hypothetical protein